MAKSEYEMLTTDDLRDFIQRHALRAEIVRLRVETPTVDAAAEALGVTSDQIIKSLVFEAGGTQVLVVAGGTSPVQAARLAAHLGVPISSVALAPASGVMELTGYPVGGVPPFGHAVPLDTFIDVKILRHEWVWGGGGESGVLLKCRPTVILGVCQAEVVDLQSPMDAHDG